MWKTIAIDEWDLDIGRKIWKRSRMFVGEAGRFRWKDEMCCRVWNRFGKIDQSEDWFDLACNDW